MPLSLLLAPYAVGAQATAIQGWDSGAYQQQKVDGSVDRRGAPFTGIDGAAFLEVTGRLPSERNAVRLLGRIAQYTPFDASFSRRDALVGLSWINVTRIGVRTRLTTSSYNTIGTVQALRGTDGAPVTIDPFSVRRTAWSSNDSLTFGHDIDRTWVYTHAVGLGLTGTLKEEVPGVVGSPYRGVDGIVAWTSLGLALQASVRTTYTARLRFERGHVFYLLDRFSPTPRNVGPLDAASATATIGVGHRLSRELLGRLEAGATVANARIGDAPLTVYPAVLSTLTHTTRAWSTYGITGLAFSMGDPRIGPGVVANAGLTTAGAPFPERVGGLVLIASADVSRTSVVAGPSSGSTTTSVGGSFAARYAFTRWLGGSLGYDARHSSFDGPAPLAPFVRHLVYLGVSFAWVSEGRAAPLPTLAIPPAP